MPRLSLLSVFATFVAVAISQKCYAVDGTALDDTYAPCNSGATHSGCCATKRTTGSADICLDSGLCMATNNDLIGTIWQNGCTDPTGKDPACAKLCPDLTTGFNGSKPVTAWNVQMCDYGKYCCRGINDRQSCCNNPTAPKVTTTSIGAIQTPKSTTTTPSPTSEPTRVVATAVSTGTPFAMPTMPSSDFCKKERTNTAIVGGTVGSILSIFILGLAGIIMWMFQRERRQRKLKEHYETQFSQTNAYRKALASSAVSMRESIFMEDMRMKSSGSGR